MSEFRTNEEIGQLIRSLREERGLTQTEVGQAIGVGKATISKIEAGARAVTAKEVVALGEYFLIPTDAILRREEDAILLRAGEAETEGVRRSLELFAECIDDYLGLEALVA